VSNPDAATTTAHREGNASRVVVSSHKPFVEKNCGACHSVKSPRDDWDWSAVRPGMCVECHPGDAGHYAVVHAFDCTF
jgi:predicted CXXCH cytochrome family protein